MTFATAVQASVGDFARFETPQWIVFYLGLTPKVRQSGNGAAIQTRRKVAALVLTSNNPSRWAALTYWMGERA